MPIEKGKKPGRPDKYTPNTQQNQQLEDAMKAADVPVTRENKEKVHRAISGLELKEFHDLVAFIKNMFEK